MLHDVYVESVQLRQATNLAALSTTSIEGFKQTLAHREKWNGHTPARVRWIKAINRVLVQNYVAKVRVSLTEVEVHKPVKKTRRSSVDAATGRKPPRILRRSLDNSAFSCDQSTPQLIHTRSDESCCCELPPLQTHGRRGSTMSDAMDHRRTLHCELPLPVQAAIAPAVKIFSAGGIAAALPQSPAPTRKHRPRLPSIADSYMKCSAASTPLLSSKPAYILSDAISRALNTHLDF